ncbi:FtsB family cell division protein [Sphingomonas sp. RS2018]
MSRTKPKKPVFQMLRKAGLPAAAVILTGFFAYFAVLGPNGVLSYRDYQRQLSKRQLEFASLDKERARLKNRVALVNPRNADPDMADELVRKELNVAHPNEVIVPLD